MGDTSGTRKTHSVERIVRKSLDFDEADDWEIRQHLAMTPEERQSAAEELRRRVFGEHPVDVRDEAKS